VWLERSASEGIVTMELFWQGLGASAPSLEDPAESSPARTIRKPGSGAKFWMILDGLTVFGSSMLATLYATHSGPMDGARRFLHGTLIWGRSMWILLAFLCGFCITLILTSRRLQLYSPKRLNNILHEQKLSVEACFVAGLLLTNALYLVKAEDIPRRIVLTTLGLVTVSLSVRRLIYRLRLYRRFERGQDTRNVLIVGNGLEGQALHQHLQNMPHLGYTCKGFADIPDTSSGGTRDPAREMVAIEALFDHARKHFIDELFVTSACDRKTVQSILELARIHRVNLRYIPYMYYGQALDVPIEYVGQFPAISLHHGYLPEFSLGVKRALDIVVSLLALLFLSPLLLAIAIAVKLETKGPVFYSAERIGKKGRVFRCFKFRTMVQDADRLRTAIMHMNERDGVLFKVTNDPRITRLGRILRKYSLDELPQFFNVLRCDMSIVGPRPPIASEVENYKLSHLRRLDVMPGITGLWQVQARQDPSFDTYISMDVAYIENWSLMLDLKIIAHTIGVILNGTGS
jgi:exopolysaccharide biosynthesis polyprenyl glycosylphosphotransferase